MDKSGLAYRLEKTGFRYNDYATILESDVAPVDPVSYTSLMAAASGACNLHRARAGK